MHWPSIAQPFPDTHSCEALYDICENREVQSQSQAVFSDVDKQAHFNNRAQSTKSLPQLKDYS